MNRRDFLLGTLATAGSGLPVATAVADSPMARKKFEKDFACREDGVIRFLGSIADSELRVWLVGDTHLGLHDARDDAYANHYARMAQWPGETKAFEAMLAEARREKIDLLVLVGDIISFPTLANVDYLKSVLENSGIEYLYVAGNHDWHFEGDAGSDIAQRDKWTSLRLKPLYRGANPLMASRVIKGVRFVTIDNSVYHVLPEQVEFFRAEAAKGDPLCLCMHIPLWFPGQDERFTCASPSWGAAIDPYWQIERRERWSPGLMPSTYAFREAVLSTPNLVGVFAGHIHRSESARVIGVNYFTAPHNSRGARFDIRFKR